MTTTGNNTPKTGTVTLTPLEHEDVRGKKLLYLKMQANGKELVINIGKATYDAAAKLLEPREEKTVVNVLPKV